MAKVKLKDNIWIEGFNENFEAIYPLFEYKSDKNKKVIYYGKTSEIPEEIAKNIVLKSDKEQLQTPFVRYDTCINSYEAFTAVQAVQSACHEENCIIYEEK